MAGPIVYRMRFDGPVLKRGFWLYVWQVTSADRTVLYVGRTGDSSSPHASSPFSRIAQHLNFKENAKANSLAKCLAAANLDPSCCDFYMVAVGPLFPEQRAMDVHRGFRDRMAALEGALAEYLRQRGYTVLGVHGTRAKLDERLWSEIVASVEPEFPVIGGALSNTPLRPRSRSDR